MGSYGPASVSAAVLTHDAQAKYRMSESECALVCCTCIGVQLHQLLADLRITDEGFLFYGPWKGRPLYPPSSNEASGSGIENPSPDKVSRSPHRSKICRG